MAKKLLPDLQQSFVDANGLPLIGGKLYSYIGNTSTPTATYTDASGVTPNTNPIILDASGRADIWLGDLTYKLVLKDSAGVLIKSWDNVQAQAALGEDATSAAASAAAAAASAVAASAAIANGLLKTLNLSDLIDVPTARTNLGLGSVNNTADSAKPVSTLQAAANATVLSSANTYTDTKVSNLVGGAGAALDTLNELAAALGNDANFSTTVSTSLANRLRVDTAAQGLTGTQKTNAQTNLGLGTMATQNASAVAITGGAISGSDVTLKSGTLSALTALTRVAGKVYYATDTMKEYVDNGTALVAVGSGSGSGGINYVTNPDFETDLAGWTKYLDYDVETISSSTVNTSTDVLTFNSYGRDGEPVILEGSALPGGLTAGTVYYIKRVSPISYSLSLTRGGANVDLTSTGSGLITVRFLVPVTGANLWASGNADFTRITSSTYTPLRGTASGMLSKPVSVRSAGSGASAAFTIDPADRGTILQASFDYSIAAGAYNDGDVQVFVYDVTNATLIYASENQNVLNHSLPSAPHTFRFQSAINSTSYRLILHVAGTGTNYFDMLVDNVKVGPQLVPKGAVVGDTGDRYAITTSLTTNVNAISTGRQVGDRLIANYTAIFTGSNTQGVNVYLPAGLKVDTTKLKWGATGYRIQVGTWTTRNPSSGTTTTGAVMAYNTGIDPAIGMENFYPPGNTPYTVIANQEFTFDLDVPILGWSGNQALSQDVSGRPVAFSRTADGQSLPYATMTRLRFNTQVVDTSALWDSTAYEAVIKEPGNYLVYAQTSLSRDAGGGAIPGTLAIFKNTSTPVIEKPTPDVQGTYKQGEYSNQNQFTALDVVPLIAGDRIWSAVTHYAVGSGTATVYNSRLIVIKIGGGSQQIAATEKVCAQYGLNSNLAVAANAIVKYDTKVEDTHGLFNTSTGLWGPSPFNGKIEVKVVFNTFTSATIYTKKGSSPAGYLCSSISGAVAGSTIEIPVSVGDTVGIYADQATNLYGVGTGGFPNQVIFKRSP